MDILVSNCSFPVDSVFAMKQLPDDFGIELQIEFGTDYFWKTTIPQLMEGRTGPLSFHGPFVNIDFGAEDLNEQAVLDCYKWSFDLYNRFRADSIVLHPDGKLMKPATEAQVAAMRGRALERIGRLSDLAKQQNVNLLVENLRPKGYGMVFDEDQFIDLFRQLPQVGCLIDTGHLSLSGWSFDKVLSALANKIRAYHINDNSGRDDDHYPIGRGVIDWGAFFRAYNAHTPNRQLILEYKHCSVADHVANARLIKTLAKENAK